MAHARLSPSNHRWPHCPGSVREEARYPDISSTAAIDGTGTHLLLEMCLGGGVRADAFLSETFGAGDAEQPLGWVATRDRCDRVQVCLDYIEIRVKSLRELVGPDGNVTVFSEAKANPGGMFGRDDWHGTADVTIIATSGAGLEHLEVIDYKDGRGWVHVPGNTQLISYLGGQARKFIASGPELVRPLRLVNGAMFQMTVVQPKTTNAPIRTEVLTPGQLIDSLETLAAAAHRTDAEDAPLIADDKGGKGYCLWCKHKQNCSAQSTAAVETIMATDITAPVEGDLLPALAGMFDKLSELDDTALADLMDTRDAMLAAYDRVEAEVQRRVDSGVMVPGYEMAPGRSTRVWNVGEDEMVAALKARKLGKDDIYPPKLASPAQILKSEKLTDRQKKKLEADLVSTKAGSMKLKKVARKTADAAVMFAAPAQEPKTPISFL